MDRVSCDRNPGRVLILRVGLVFQHLAAVVKVALTAAPSPLWRGVNDVTPAATMAAGRGSMAGELGLLTPGRDPTSAAAGSGPTHASGVGPLGGGGRVLTRPAPTSGCSAVQRWGGARDWRPVT